MKKNHKTQRTPIKTWKTSITTQTVTSSSGLNQKWRLCLFVCNIYICCRMLCFEVSAKIYSISLIKSNHDPMSTTGEKNIALVFHILLPSFLRVPMARFVLIMWVPWLDLGWINSGPSKYQWHFVCKTIIPSFTVINYKVSINKNVIPAAFLGQLFPMLFNYPVGEDCSLQIPTN